MIWMLWAGILILLISGVVGAWAWNGELLKLLSKKKAKGPWLVSLIGATLSITIIAILLIIISSDSLLFAQLAALATIQPAKLWPIITLLFIGGLLVGLPVHLEIMGYLKLNKEQNKRVFYTGLFILVLGCIGLLWLLLPGNFLPG